MFYYVFLKKRLARAALEIFEACSYTLNEKYSLMGSELETKSYTLKTIHGNLELESI